MIVWKGTPGPWGRIRDNHFRVEQDDTGYTSWIAVGPEKGLTIALAVTDGDCEDDEVEANAKGLSAVPQMVEALADLIASYQAYRRAEGDDDTSDSIETAIEALKAAGVEL